jgi:hypothetical protein
MNDPNPTTTPTPIQPFLTFSTHLGRLAAKQRTAQQPPVTAPSKGSHAAFNPVRPRPEVKEQMNRDLRTNEFMAPS